jgi:hypothetical protein
MEVQNRQKNEKTGYAVKTAAQTRHDVGYFSGSELTNKDKNKHADRVQMLADDPMHKVEATKHVLIHTAHGARKDSGGQAGATSGVQHAGKEKLTGVSTNDEVVNTKKTSSSMSAREETDQVRGHAADLTSSDQNNVVKLSQAQRRLSEARAAFLAADNRKSQIEREIASLPDVVTWQEILNHHSHAKRAKLVSLILSACVCMYVCMYVCVYVFMLEILNCA